MRLSLESILEFFSINVLFVSNISVVLFSQLRILLTLWWLIINRSQILSWLIIWVIPILHSPINICVIKIWIILCGIHWGYMAVILLYILLRFLNDLVLLLIMLIVLSFIFIHLRFVVIIRDLLMRLVSWRWGILVRDLFSGIAYFLETLKILVQFALV